MAKRKRLKDVEALEPEKLRIKRREDVAAILDQTRKRLLSRALKNAKGFERQKLGKRLKLASTDGSVSEVARINREILALRGLDLRQAGEAHLHKSLLKIKAFAESGLLPENLKSDVPKPEGTEEERALNNVLSGIFNMKSVKECIRLIVQSLSRAMGITLPMEASRKGLKELAAAANDETSSSRTKETKVHDRQALNKKADSLSSRENKDNHTSRADNQPGGPEQDSDMDSDDLAQYDDRIGGSSDEDGFDEDTPHPDQSKDPKTALDPSLSPSPSVSVSPPPRNRNKVPKSSKQNRSAPKIGGSTFLPTLMGGYCSGSESSASELDEPPRKKNRAGQTARRMTWEKKYGDRANHIQKGLGIKGRDQGWDPRAGATHGSQQRRGGSSRGRGKGGSRGDGGFAGGRPRTEESHATGENATALQPRKQAVGKIEGMGVLHPSWQAAKKAKELEKTASFQGKKITFD